MLYVQYNSNEGLLSLPAIRWCGAVSCRPVLDFSLTYQIWDSIFSCDSGGWGEGLLKSVLSTEAIRQRSFKICCAVLCTVILIKIEPKPGPKHGPFSIISVLYCFVTQIFVQYWFLKGEWVRPSIEGAWACNLKGTGSTSGFFASTHFSWYH